MIPFRIELDDSLNDSPMECSLWEGVYLGVYLSWHPVEALGADKNYFDIAGQVTSMEDGREVILLCIIESVKVINTKRGDQMAFLVLCDGNTSRVDATVFPTTYKLYHEFLEEGNIVGVIGKVQNNDERQGLIVDMISRNVTQFRQVGTGKLLKVEIARQEETSLAVHELPDSEE